MKRRFIIWAFVLSLLLHVIIIWIYFLWMRHTLFFTSLSPENAEIVHQFNEKQIHFYLIDTPQASDILPERVDAVSDKVSIAADDRLDNIAYTQTPNGEWRPSHRARSSMQSISKYQRQNRTQKIERSNYGERIQPSEPFTRDQLFGVTSKQKPGQYSIESHKTEENSNVEHFGEFSLNTYAWEYAPYLLEIRERIQDHMFPPPVFTYLGYGGVNVVRFRIQKNGAMEGPELLAYRGEKALIRTSQAAIKTSAPFPPLPNNFPEEFLEVTAKFQYITYRPIEEEIDE